MKLLLARLLSVRRSLVQIVLWGKKFKLRRLLRLLGFEKRSFWIATWRPQNLLIKKQDLGNMSLSKDQNLKNRDFFRSLRLSDSEIGGKYGKIVISALL